MNEIIIKACSLILTILASLITIYVIPWLRQKTTASQYEELERLIVKSVQAMEQLYTPEQWEKKKETVIDYIMSKVMNDPKLSSKFTYDDINYIIEGIVYEVKH